MREYVNVRNEAVPVRSDAFLSGRMERGFTVGIGSMPCETKPFEGSDCKKKKSPRAEAHLCNGYAEQWC